MRRAIGELESVVAYVINNLNGHHVVVTSDHGFLFTESAPGEPDKSSLSDKPPNAVKAKKRYLLGPNLGDHDSIWHGSTAVTAGAGESGGFAESPPCPVVTERNENPKRTASKHNLCDRFTITDNFSCWVETIQG